MSFINGINSYFKNSLFIFLVIFSMAIGSCKKYLEKKPVQNIAVPSNLDDLQALLNNPAFNNNAPGYLEFVADNYYISSTTWSSTFIDERNAYVWLSQAIPSEARNWTESYKAIYYANFVLEYLPKVGGEGNQNAYNSIKGAALFFRAFQFHQLAQLFCKPYSGSADTDLGIIVRLTSAVEERSVRSTVQQTYEQIISDLKAAADLLPATSLYATRPNKAAAYGMLARVYLSMRDYANAKTYASYSLALKSALLDYNTLNTSSTTVLPGSLNNPEIEFLSNQTWIPTAVMNSANVIIDSGLLRSYNNNDLRSSVFFQTNTAGFTWRGNYAYDLIGLTYGIFDGIATDEIMLIRAECNARVGNKDSAMLDLNTLLRNRWKTGTFVDLTATDQADALNKVLTERRKELLFRGLRWSDLRRFNLEGANTTLTRFVNNTLYTLPPNDLRWVLLIPGSEISRSGIQQNPR